MGLCRASFRHANRSRQNPGCQQITTVIGPDGKPIVLNKIWRTAANLENSGPDGQRGIDMAPAAPHTRVRQARSCASCHTNSKALGYGTHDGRYMTGYPKGIRVDVATAQGEMVSKHTKIQIPPIPELPMNLDQVVTRDNKQLQTVGHHWPLSGPLPKEMRDKIEKVRVCITCHQHIPVGSFTGIHKKSFHNQLMERTWAPGLTFHSIFENKKPQIP